MRKYLFIIGLLICILPVSAQKEERKQIRQGNKLYQNEQYTEAEIAYRKALEVNADSPQATFNLGNALYRQEKAQDALEQYQHLIDKESVEVETGGGDKKRLASLWHNVGNICMQGEDYGNAIQSYCKSLILNPKDDETRYNLALAQALYKQQQQDQQNQEQEQEQEENQEDQQQQQQQQEQPQEHQDNENHQDQEQPEDAQEQLSREKAQELLDALMQDEEEVQEKVKKLQMQNGQRTQTDKDW